jgi:O-succinylbenzoic acid--CoA ligase
LNEFQKSESTQSLKAVLLGGSQIPGTLIERALQKDLPLYTSYGSTEMSSQATTTTIGDLKLNSESSGKLLQDRELKIDSDGEILVKGKTLGKGYISGKGVLPFTDSNGWFHTGDLGSLDDNQNLIVTGRKDNMFVSGGENIHPEEIEQQLLFYKEIIDICVVDIPDVEFGARPVAFVKSEYDEKINENDLKEYLKNKLAPFKIPDRFFSWPEEMNGIKPDRWYLRGLAIDLMR